MLGAWRSVVGTLLVLGLTYQCYYATQLNTSTASLRDFATQRSASVPHDVRDRPKKIALLFLINKNFPFEVLWNRYLPPADEFEQINQIHNVSSPSSAPYSIYIHSMPEQKHLTLTVPRFKRRVIPSVPSEWFWNLLDPQLQLLAYAQGDPDNEKFYFISDSSIPLKPWPQLYRKVMSQPGSSFCIAPRNQSGSSYLRGIENLFPDPNHWRKADMWTVLSRDAAKFLHYSAMEARGVMSFLQNARIRAAPDETVFISMLLRGGMQDDIINYPQLEAYNTIHQGDCRSHWYYWPDFTPNHPQAVTGGLSKCQVEQDWKRKEWEALSTQVMDDATEESLREEMMASLTKPLCVKLTPYNLLRVSETDLEELLEGPMWLARKVSTGATVVLTTTRCGKRGQIMSIADFLSCRFG